MDRLLRCVHRNVSRYAPLDVNCRQIQIRRNLEELVLTVTLRHKTGPSIGDVPCLLLFDRKGHGSPEPSDDRDHRDEGENEKKVEQIAALNTVHHFGIVEAPEK